MKIGFVGVGEMGMPMVERLRAASYPVTFFARRPEVIERAITLGAIAAPAMQRVADGADVVIVCVYSDEQVRDVCLGDDGLIAAMRAGTTLVNHTTGSPTTAGLLLEHAARRGVRVLDAALSGGPGQIAVGTLTLLIGGDAAVLEDVMPVLATYSDPILHVGRVGDGQRIKLLNNALFGANVALVVEAERVARGLGIDPQVALQAITNCSGDSRVLRMATAIGSASGMRERAGRFIRKDVAVVQQVAAELGVDLGMLGTAAIYEGDNA